MQFPVRSRGTQWMQDHYCKDGDKPDHSESNPAWGKEFELDPVSQHRPQRVPLPNGKDKQAEQEIVKNVNAARPSGVMRQSNRSKIKAGEGIDEMNHHPVDLLGQHY